MEKGGIPQGIASFFMRMRLQKSLPMLAHARLSILLQRLASSRSFLFSYLRAVGLHAVGLCGRCSSFGFSSRFGNNFSSFGIGSFGCIIGSLVATRGERYGHDSSGHQN